MSIPRRLRRDGIRTLLDRLPWWLAVAVGLVGAGLGAWLIVRPLSSINLLVITIGIALIVNGFVELAHPRPGWVAAVGAAALVAAGIAVLAFRGLSVGTLAYVVAFALLAMGILRAVAAFRRRAPRPDGAASDAPGRPAGATGRATDLMLGLAAVIAGVTALAWPDITLLVTAVAFGGWTFVFGVSLAWNAAATAFGRRPRSYMYVVGRGRDSRSARWFARSARFLGALVVLVLVAAVGVVSVQLHAGVPHPDAFYSAPAVVPPEPGVLLRAERFTRAMPTGSEAWRILYTTTNKDGEPTVASGLVIAPTDASPGTPLIAWAHGTTGFAENCAPTLLPDPLAAGAMFIADQVIAEGWAMVATDYAGLGTAGPHPYLIGEGEARSVLDSIRAAHQLKNLDLSDQTVIWGHSQGGNAALWSGGLAASYAPELHLAGVAALAPASDLVGLVTHLPQVTGGILFAAYALASYAAQYPDVTLSDYVDPSARTVMTRLALRCLADPRTLVSVLHALAIKNDRDVYSRPLASDPLLPKLKQNTPTLPIAAPLLIAQGLTDALVLPTVQRGFARSRCDAGQKLQYLAVPDEDHVGLVEADSPLIPPLLSWTRDRFAGKPAADDCGGLPTS